MPGATPATGATEEHPLRRKTAGFRGVAPGNTGGAIRAARSCRYARSGQQARGRSGAAALPARCDSGCNRGPVSESHAGAAHQGCPGRRWRPRLRPGLFAAARRFPRRLYQRSDPVAAPVEEGEAARERLAPRKATRPPQGAPRHQWTSVHPPAEGTLASRSSARSPAKPKNPTNSGGARTCGRALGFAGRWDCPAERRREVQPRPGRLEPARWG